MAPLLLRKLGLAGASLGSQAGYQVGTTLAAQVGYQAGKALAATKLVQPLPCMSAPDCADNTSETRWAKLADVMWEKHAETP